MNLIAFTALQAIATGTAIVLSNSIINWIKYRNTIEDFKKVCYCPKYLIIGAKFLNKSTKGLLNAHPVGSIDWISR